MPAYNLIEADQPVINEQGGASTFKLSSALPNLVRGREVTIVGPNNARCQNVTIVAGTVIFAPGSSIDTSGYPGAPNNPPGLKPPIPPGDSAPGVDGPQGGNATGAGSVEIIALEIQGTVNLKAIGGQGGRGGDGGDGHNATTANKLPLTAGGDAGRAGAPGVSGDGGHLAVRALDVSAVGVQADLSGGPSVEPATPGKPGWGSQFLHWGHDGEIDVEKHGPYGAIAPPGTPGPRGRDGNLDKTNLDLAAFAGRCSVAQMRKTLAAGEFDYFNDTLDVALEKLRWVATISPAVPPGDLPDEVDQLAGQASQTTDLERSLPADPVSVGRRADLLARQIVHGCGYFGLPRNYVPTLRIDYFKDQLGGILTSAIAAETSITDIITAALANERTDTQLGQAMARCIALITALETEQLNDAAQAIQLQDIIRTLEGQTEVQKGRMLAAQAQFNEAVQNATNGCSLGQVLTVVKAIVAVAGAVYTAGGSLALLAAQIGTTGLALYESVQTTDDDGNTVSTNELNPTYTKLATAVGSIADVSEKFHKVEDVLAHDPDAGRVVVLQGDMDQLAADFDKKVGTAPVGQSIKDDLKYQAHRYLDLVQARNKKILERDGLILKVHQNDAAIFDQRANLAQLSAMRAGNANPPLADYARTLTNMLEALRKNLRYLIWEELRALALWSLDSLDTPGGPIFNENQKILINGTRAGDLLLTHTQLSAGFLTYQGAQAGPYQPIDPEQIVVIRLSADEAEYFSQSRHFAFAIAREAFPDIMTAIMVTGVKVIVPAVPKFSGELLHSGRHLFVRPDGKTTVEYSSISLRVGILESPEPVTLTLGDGQYTGVSPLSDWNLSARGVVGEAELLKVRELRLSFSGRFRAVV